MPFLPMVLLCAAANAFTVFDFDGLSLGASTTFTDTVNGLSARFSRNSSARTALNRIPVIP
jgi:hypothetical protein